MKKKMTAFTLVEGVGTCDKLRKSAFTLAEVLITLGIIGVVAALTIPTLVANYQTKSWNTAASTFEARFGEALKVMNTQGNLANLGTTERFVQELQKQMKITKVCDNTKITECFSDKMEGTTSVIDVAKPETYLNTGTDPYDVSEIKTAKQLGQKDWGTNAISLMFANGATAVLAYNPKCSANQFNNDSVVISGDKNAVSFGTDCVAVLYDTSGFSSPNEKGKDIRLSSMANVGDEGCRFKINGKCVTKVASAYSAYNLEQCEAIKDKYGISCNSPVPSTDYWAAAVDFCGGSDKFISLEDFGYLMRYAFDDQTIPIPPTRGYVPSTKFIKSSKIVELGISSYNKYWIATTTQTRGTAPIALVVLGTPNNIGPNANYKQYIQSAVCVE